MTRATNRTIVRLREFAVFPLAMVIPKMIRFDPPVLAIVRFVVRGLRQMFCATSSNAFTGRLGPPRRGGFTPTDLECCLFGRLTLLFYFMRPLPYVILVTVGSDISVAGCPRSRLRDLGFSLRNTILIHELSPIRGFTVFLDCGVAALVQLPLQAVVLHLTARTRRPIPSGWGNHSMLQ
jgi:hypothetical protein